MMNIKRHQRQLVISGVAVVALAVVIADAALTTINISEESEDHVEIKKHEKFTSANHFKRR